MYIDPAINNITTETIPKKTTDSQEHGLFGDMLASSLNAKRAEALKPKEPEDTMQAKAEANGMALFMEYMNKSQAERMEDAWLKSHGMTREELEALPPEERAKILEEMRADIEEQLKLASERKLEENT